MKASWLRDFVLGVRLAVGGGRTSWGRLALSTVGIGMAVLVLLFAASAGNVRHTQNSRAWAAEENTEPMPGVAPLQVMSGYINFDGLDINGKYLHPTGRNSPLPPGVTRFPGPNEIMVSQALADLLRSDDGARLRPRFPERIVGIIDPAAVERPSTLQFYAGAGEFGADSDHAESVYSFGASHAGGLDSTLIVIGLIGAVALLIPILIFVATSSRIAGEARDRRLAALRLVGAGSWQVRRIAAAESLVGALFGIVLGGIGFLLARQLAADVDVAGWSAYPTDVVPSPPLVVLIVLVIPILAVGTSVFALRRTVIEPLGVVRAGKPVRRRLWWRIMLIAVGVALLLIPHQGNMTRLSSEAVIVVGASGLLIGVPTLLPWLLERIVGNVKGGVPSWQLAIRRLQLDSGTPARVVAGVAVVLAGAIALQTVLLAASSRYHMPSESAGSPQIQVVSNWKIAPQVDATVRSVHGVRSSYTVQDIEGRLHDGKSPPADDGSDYTGIAVASCSMITSSFNVDHCTDGDAFVAAGGSGRYRSGMRIGVIEEHSQQEVGTWVVPAALHQLPTVAPRHAGISDDLVVTPGALSGVTLPADRTSYTYIDLDPNASTVPDDVANALGRYTWQVDVESVSTGLTTTQREFQTMHDALLVGSLFTLLMAGVSMLVLALEQVRERRRPISVLAAAGTPRAVLARSLLWQTALPVAIGVLVAMAIGIGLAALVIRLTSMSMSLDLGMLGIYGGATVVLVLLVITATLPSLRSAMRLSALRTE